LAERDCAALIGFMSQLKLEFQSTLEVVCSLIALF
jgi:hypothetical protein